MIFFSLIFKSEASWPWIASLVVYALLSLCVVIPNLVLIFSPKSFDGEPLVLIWFGICGAYVISVGPALFCCYHQFCGWSASGWWFYLFMVLGFVAAVVPGGLSIMTLILQNMQLITTVPTWLWIMMIVLDAIQLLALVFSIAHQIRNKRRVVPRRYW